MASIRLRYVILFIIVSCMTYNVYILFNVRQSTKANFHNKIIINTPGMTVTDTLEKRETKSVTACNPAGFTNSTIFGGYSNRRSLKGRLGNSIFVYASLLGIQSRTGSSISVSKGVEQQLQRLFDVKINTTNVPGGVVTLSETAFAKFDRSLLEISSRQVRLIGYLQSWRYFDHVSSNIRNCFRIHNTLLTKGAAYLRALRRQLGASQDVTFVGVHVRRVDKTKRNSVKLGYKTATIQYLLRAMRYFRVRAGSDVLFVVVTDSQNWCQLHVTGSDVHVVSEMSDVQHFALLSQCNHSVITVGTFGWWAAWLAGGTTVYYDEPYVKDSTVSQSFSAQDYFLPSWIPMS